VKEAQRAPTASALFRCATPRGKRHPSGKARGTWLRANRRSTVPGLPENERGEDRRHDAQAVAVRRNGRMLLAIR